MADRPEPPVRRLHLRLDLQADSISDLAGALHNIADDIDIENREERDQTSGGWSSGHHFTLTCDPEQTGDRYREQLEAWRVEGVVYPFRYEVIHRLVATVDALRAERDAARADRVCWREEHNQVAAERDALAVELRNLASETAKVLLTVKPNLDRAYLDDPRWTPWTRWVEKRLDPLIRRALDASPTEGNPE